MTGRRLYEHYCDATADHFTNRRGGRHGQATSPLPAWASLSDTDRRRWSALAKRITPKKREPRTITLVRVGEKKIQAIKELRALTRWSLLDAKLAVDAIQAGYVRKVDLPKGVTVKDAERALSEWTVVG